MRYNKVIIFLFTILLSFSLCCLFLWEKETDKSSEFPLSFCIESDYHSERVKCWERGEGEFYVFFPGYLDLKHISIRLENGAWAVIGNATIKDGMSFDSFSLDKPYKFFCEYEGCSEYGSICFVQSANVPTMYIDTRSGNMNYVHADKGNQESGSVRIYTNNGDLDYLGTLEFIKGRGNATWLTEKKPYSLKLSTSADLLGMGSANKWILLANALDPSHLRNKIAYDLADAVGMQFTPDCRWVDLYLNGEYAGLYLLAERNEVHEQRVDISYSNSFLVSWELGFRLISQDKPYIVTENEKFLRIHYSSMNKDMLTQIWQSAENAILSENGIDPITGKNWRELIDVDSWAMRMLLDEILVNYDGGSLSQFFYYDDSGKIKAGPVWDMDNCLAQGGWQAVVPNAIMTYREHILYDSDTPLFFYLYQKPEFRERVLELYETIFLPAIKRMEKEGIQVAADFISQSAFANEIRWNVPDHEAETKKILSFLEQRIAFLNDYWYREDEYHLVYIAGGYSVWACFAVRDGECIPNVLETTENWEIIGTEEIFDVSQPIYEDLTIVQSGINFEEIKAVFNGIGE